MATGRVTMEDVAARAGVSRALVSIVFRGAPGAAEATRQRVMQAARDLDFHPDSRASRLGRTRTRTRTLGVVFGVGHDFHGDVLDGIYAAVGAASYYDVLLSGVTRRRTEEVAVRTLLAERCEALLLLGSGLTTGQLASLAHTVPVVSLLRPVRAAGVDVVRTQDADGLGQAVRHLHELGHRHIAHLEGGRAVGAAERRRGYRTELRRLADDPRVELPGGLTEVEGAIAAEAFLAMPMPRPTGVAAFNDRCALGFVDVVRRRGLRVPEDVSVVGFDDIDQAGYAHVSLTTIRQDVEGLGRAAIERVARRLDHGEPDAREVVVEPSLVVRGSSAPPRLCTPEERQNTR